MLMFRAFDGNFHFYDSYTYGRCLVSKERMPRKTFTEYGGCELSRPYLLVSYSGCFRVKSAFNSVSWCSHWCIIQRLELKLFFVGSLSFVVNFLFSLVDVALGYFNINKVNSHSCK